MFGETIFVMIAAYKDLEIIPTLYDLYGKAKYPENIRVSICWQGDFNDVRELDEWPNVRVVYINPEESKGLGFARSLAQAHYDNEDYTFQLDAHHRFDHHWDEWMIDEIKKLQQKGYSKPALTAYAGSYSSLSNQLLETVPCRIIPDPRYNGFRPDWWTIPFMPDFIYNEQEPVRARFASGHYIFTVGKFADEYRFDPFCYFWGEELTLSVRMYTMGYDLFHPHELKVWHRYVWNGSGGDMVEKQYDVFKDKKKRESYWMGRLRTITNQTNHTEGYYIPNSLSLGTHRSLSDYEEFAGISFANRTVKIDW